MASTNDMFAAEAYADDAIAGGSAIRSRFRVTPSVNLSQKRVLGQLSQMLSEGGNVKALVVGSGTQAEELKCQFDQSNVELVCTDIDADAAVDYYCDAHNLPFQDGVFDAVITTAVLEHVLEPHVVVAEMTRVLRQGGLVYSELPFMQQVHEGAYDFSRYSMGGHRWLFREFDEVDAGPVAGPATALVWAIENMAKAVFRRGNLSRLAGIAARLIFFWLKYLDYLIANTPAGLDAASCTYFLGRKTESMSTGQDIVDRYDGAQSLRHV